MLAHITTAHFKLRQGGIFCWSLHTNLNMADFLALEEEPKQEESIASVKSETEEPSEETPNGVKT